MRPLIGSLADGASWKMEDEREEEGIKRDGRWKHAQRKSKLTCSANLNGANLFIKTSESPQLFFFLFISCTNCINIPRSNTPQQRHHPELNTKTQKSHQLYIIWSVNKKRNQHTAPLPLQPPSLATTATITAQPCWPFNEHPQHPPNNGILPSRFLNNDVDQRHWIDAVKNRTKKIMGKVAWSREKIRNHHSNVTVWWRSGIIKRWWCCVKCTKLPLFYSLLYFWLNNKLACLFRMLSGRSAWFTFYYSFFSWGFSVN